MTKIITWAVVLIVIIGAGFWAWQSGMFASFIPGSKTTQTPTTNDQANNTQPQQQTQKSDLPSGDTDTSDAALSQDTTAVDGQMSSYSQDAAAVDSSLSDKQTVQEY